MKQKECKKKRERIKYIGIFILLCCLPFICKQQVKATNIAGGTCGANITWVLDDQGTLTISGSSDMSSDSFGWKYYEDEIKTVVVEYGITSIGEYAFSRCANITAVSLPDTVKIIGERSFAGCSNLNEISFPEKLETIDGYAFWGCEKLEKISLPDSIIEVGEFAFSYCSGLKEVNFGNSTKYIGNHAFESCTGLSAVTIPDSVCYVGDYNTVASITVGSVFMGCTNLETVTVGSGVTMMGRFTFSGCTNLKTIYFRGNAPEFGDESYDCVFENVTATAFYPENNNTWKDYHLSNHSGTIVWETWNSPVAQTETSDKAGESKVSKVKVGKVKIGKWKKTYDSRKDKNAVSDGVTYTIKWAKVRGASGYEVYTYETVEPKGSWYCMKNYSKKRKASLSFSFGSCYAVKAKVRAYKIVDGIKVYGKWSKVRKKVVREKR